MPDLVMKVLLWLLTVVGGATMLENTLENYVMAHVPDWAKGIVVPIISVIFALVAHLQAGMPLQDALTAALGLSAAATAIHNSPTLTTADWPAPPVDADGLPGVPPSSGK